MGAKAHERFNDETLVESIATALLDRAGRECH